MEYLTVALLAISIILSIISIICVKKNKQNLELNERDKKELTNAFSQNVEIISSTLAHAQEKSAETLTVRLHAMDDKILTNNKNVEARLATLERAQTEKLENIRITLERNLATIQASNEKKLSEIKQTVDDKLTSTLNARFKESFKILTEELEKVSKSLGEMQNVSKDVGNLTKILSNVKTTGIFGEIQLGAIIDQILAPEQYLKNVVTNKEGRDPVEFAIKMPGGETGEILLPIDSKFPYTLFSDMQTAYETNDFALFETKRKELVQRIRGMAKDIKDKYICPPATTNFAIMFLPVESLYSEVVKLGLIEELQTKYSVTVAGPTTMAALLNSLQMGFKTLAIQRKSAEVWSVLSSVKTEFDKFNEILLQIQGRLNAANVDLDKLIGTRTRAITRSLKNVTCDSIED